jgi:hypothetical protein
VQNRRRKKKKKMRLDEGGQEMDGGEGMDVESVVEKGGRNRASELQSSSTARAPQEEKEAAELGSSSSSFPSLPT